jgi:hypothetical protein
MVGLLRDVLRFSSDDVSILPSSSESLKWTSLKWKSHHQCHDDSRSESESLSRQSQSDSLHRNIPWKTSSAPKSKTSFADSPTERSPETPITINTLTDEEKQEAISDFQKKLPNIIKHKISFPQKLNLIKEHLNRGYQDLTEGRIILDNENVISASRGISNVLQKQTEVGERVQGYVEVRGNGYPCRRINIMINY